METNFHFLSKEITDLIKQRNILDDETLLSLYRELETMSRLLSIEIFYNKERRKHLRQLALHQRVNYLQTPEAIYGLLPHVETSLELSGYHREVEYQRGLKSNQGQSALILSELEF